MHEASSGIVLVCVCGGGGGYKVKCFPCRVGVVGCCFWGGGGGGEVLDEVFPV